MLAMLGMAVGTGNIWRFPRIAAKNGGGEFLDAPTLQIDGFRAGIYVAFLFWTFIGRLF